MLIYLYSSDLNSLNYYPNNVLSDFRIQLPQRHQLEGEWEIALLQAQIPFSWVDERSAHLWVKYNVIFYIEKPKKSNPEEFDVYTKTAPFLTFIVHIDKRSINDLTSVLNSQTSVIQFERSNTTTHIQFTINNDKILEQHVYNWAVDAQVFSVELSEQLADIFGFKTKKFLFDSDDPEPCIAELPPFLPFYISAFAVHCDLAESQLVNNSYAPLLRIIETDRKEDQKMQTSIFQTPIYVPMRETHFNSIRIQILDLDGERIRFEGGTVILCIDIRPKGKQYIS